MKCLWGGASWLDDLHQPVRRVAEAGGEAGHQDLQQECPRSVGARAANKPRHSTTPAPRRHGPRPGWPPTGQELLSVCGLASC